MSEEEEAPPPLSGADPTPGPVTTEEWLCMCTYVGKSAGNGVPS